MVVLLDDRLVFGDELLFSDALTIGGLTVDALALDDASSR